MSAGQAPPSRAPSFLPKPKFLRRHKTALPEALAVVFGAGLVLSKWLLAEADRLIAKPERTNGWFRLVVSPSTVQRPRCRFGALVRTEIVAMNRLAANQLGQLVARLDAAGPGIGVIVDADLVEFRRIEPSSR